MNIRVGLEPPIRVLTRWFDISGMQFSYRDIARVNVFEAMLLARGAGTSAPAPGTLPPALPVAVRATREAAAARHDLTLAEIYELRKRSGADISYRALGICESRFGHTIQALPTGAARHRSVSVTVPTLTIPSSSTLI